MRQNYKLLVFCFILLNLYSWVLRVESDFGIPSIIKYVLAVSVVGILIAYRIANPSKPEPGILFSPFVGFIIVWSIILLIFAVLRFNALFDIQRLFGQPYFFLPYLLPVFILYTKFDIDFISLFYKYASFFIAPAIFVQVFIILSGISVNERHIQQYTIGIFDLGISFLLLTAHFSKKRYVFNASLLYTVLMIFLFAHYGRRGVLIEYGLLLLFLIIMRLKSPLLYFKDRLKIYLLGSSILIFIFTYGHIFTTTYAFQRGFSRAAFMASRSTVFEGFFYDFSSISDLIFGRGLDGIVLRSLRDNVQDLRYFDTIENGFLTILLKGGLLFLIPFVIILLRAVYLGFFRSNNDMVKGLASLILIYFIIMFNFNLPDFSFKYIFLWISINICFTPKMRNLSNEEIFTKINS